MDESLDASFERLVATIRSGDAMLFTGAGFSKNARDVDGQPLPDSEQMRAELWALCFPDAQLDDSSLSDLFDVAMCRAPEKLAAYVARRLSVGDAPLPPHLARWFSAPWRRVYTLNVDDLETAIARQFPLPRPLRTCVLPEDDTAAALEIVHLNGVVHSSPAELMFSTLQYAARLCGTDRTYAALVRDLGRAPFVFAGTKLDEIVLWQHVEMRRRTPDQKAMRHSFIVTPTLSQARRLLLHEQGVTWIPATIEDIAAHL